MSANGLPAKRRAAIGIALTGLVLLVSAAPAYGEMSVPAAIYSDSHAKGVNKPKGQVAEELAKAGVQDVDSYHWAAGSLTVLLQAGLLAPAADGRLEPDAPVSRATSIAVLARVLGIAPLTASPAEALAQAAQAGYAEGGDSEQAMTRLAVAHLLATALGARPRPSITRQSYPFADYDLVSATDAALLARLYDLGIFRGYEDRTFRPYGSLTTAELAILVDRIFGVYSR